ncbi:MAG: 1-acyl-sn-glycerol-3-phosphate acyltransferase [Bacteriovoracaceae bacterium]|nr:1-acyl-sn-glycerol-3-phosphate acyltransferase [Bacteriovoracaceae bacterium]
MEETVLSYPRLSKRLKGRGPESKKAIDMLYEIAADFSHQGVRPSIKILDFIFKKLYDGIKVSFEGDYRFDELVKDNSVVVVPNHQSHADYVALNYYIYKTFRFPLFVAGGINLNVFPIGKIFRKSGCFFIRRSFSSDIMYRLVLEAYIYYLLKNKKPIEFFFEGGRTRSGKVLAPKLGLYQLVFEAHNALKEHERYPLKFVPVSIVHDNVPEQRTLSRELQGAKKKKESFLQILKVFKIFSKQMGSINVRFGAPIAPTFSEDLKDTTRTIAFDCFRSVGRNLMVTPTSLISMILLDAPDGALKWESIMSRAHKVMSFCRRNDIPLSPSFDDVELREVLEHSVDLMIANKTVKAMGRTRFGHVFYFIRSEARLEVLYFKNSITHHFVIPWMVNLFWINLFNGGLKSESEFRSFLDAQLKRMQIEFFLPDSDEMIVRVLRTISDCIGRELTDLSECSHLAHEDLFKLAAGLSVFSRAASYIVECHFISGRAIRALAREGKDSFSFDEFNKEFKGVFEFEMKHGNLVKYKECSSRPLVRNTLKYFVDGEIISGNLGQYSVTNRDKLEKIIERLKNDLSTELMFSVRED